MGRMNSVSIERFLWGQLGPHEQADFLVRCAGNADILRQLEHESAFEALFYDRSWGLQGAAAGFMSESEWAQCAAPMPAIPADGTSLLFPESGWDQLIKKACAAVAAENRDKSRIVTVKFPKIFRYLAAACFIAAVAGGFIWKQFSISPRDTPRTVVIAHEKNTPAEQAHENDRRPALVFDTLFIYRTPGRARTSISADCGEGIVRLGDKTAILLEKDAAIAVTERNDTAVAVSVSRGSALFTVEKCRYRSFSVATAACDIAVTGTIFRLYVQYDTTIVSVLEGSVQAIQKAGKTGIVVGAGMSAHIRPDTVMIDYGDTAATFLYRSSLLHDYLTENGVWENGRFVRSGIIPDTGIQP
jgi:hypothetical protein